ncbi:hypothetical protein BpHYR1_001568 [Brachionus plicatilis]|uniref:Uncharacterized protein n=1 Tax=Brachionus plicatilis TaxID=10195 RepID=A0A3M7Q9E4_BRAPC|nr:hypothetical protein BpHYR1_001568 [Brachionus plicatilis]
MSNGKAYRESLQITPGFWCINSHKPTLGCNFADIRSSLIKSSCHQHCSWQSNQKKNELEKEIGSKIEKGMKVRKQDNLDQNS